MHSARDLVKAAANAAAVVLVAPLILSFEVRARLIGRDRALQGSTQALAWIPGLPGQYLRRAFLRAALEGCATSATIEYGTIFSQAGASIGEDAYIGPCCHVGLVHIGTGVLIGAGVHLPSGGATHGFADLMVPIRLQPHSRSCVHIGDGTWIGSGAIVMADVGRESVVGAGSVVTRTLPEYSIAVGSPARVLRSRLAAATPVA